MRSGRLDQIGLSWLKHGWFALSSNQCTNCQDGDPSGNHLGVGLGLTHPLSPTLIFKYPTTEAIVRYLEQDVLHFEVAEELSLESQKDIDEMAQSLTEVDQLSDEEASELLDAELDSLDVQEVAKRE